MSPTSLIVRFRRELELTSIGRIGDVIVLERPRGREGEVTGDKPSSPSRFFSDFDGVRCSTGCTFSLSGDPLPFPPRRTSGEAHAVDDESSGVETVVGFEVVLSSSLDTGEEGSLPLLGGRASRDAGEFVGGFEFVPAEAEAAERRPFSAVAKASSVPFELYADPAEEPATEEVLEVSIRDRTDRTEFLF